MSGVATPLEGCLRQLHLPAFREHCHAQAAIAEKSGSSFTRYLHELCELELVDRRQRRIQRRLKQSKLPRAKTLDSFLDFPDDPREFVEEAFAFAPWLFANTGLKQDMLRRYPIPVDPRSDETIETVLQHGYEAWSKRMKGFTRLDGLISSSLIFSICLAREVACLDFEAFAEKRLTKALSSATCAFFLAFSDNKRSFTCVAAVMYSS